MTREKASPDPENRSRSPDTAGPGARRHTDLREIVTALRDRVEVLGLRSVAREVGMSATGLRKILDGSNPYQNTSKKLVQWFTRHRAGRYETAKDAAIEVLLQGMPRSRRERARKQIWAILRSDEPRARSPRARPAK